MFELFPVSALMTAMLVLRHKRWEPLAGEGCASPWAAFEPNGCPHTLCSGTAAGMAAAALQPQPRPS